MKYKIIGVVFSRDRAMQIDGALRSFFSHCIDAYKIEFTVIYKATSIFHKVQYNQLAKDYAKYKVKFVEESRFRHDLIKLLNKFSNSCQTLWLCLNLIRTLPFMGFLNKVIHNYNHKQYVMFLVDDNLFVRDFSIRTVIDSLAQNPDCLCFSLRLGKNIDFCYPTSSPQSIPPFVELADDVLKFNWTSSINDFAYPLEVSSSIYRIRDILPFLNYWSFNNPNTLETVLAGKKRFFARRQPCLLCYSKSVTFSNPINKVQHSVPNCAGDRIDYSAENLLQMFDQGYRIDVTKYINFVPKSCHQEVELVMVPCQPRG